MAGVDDDSEGSDDFSDGEIDIWEEENLEGMRAVNERVPVANGLLDGLHSAPPLRPEHFEISEALEIADVQRIVKHYRRKAQVSQSSQDSITPEAEIGGHSFRVALDELPGLDDLCMFGVSCKVR